MNQWAGVLSGAFANGADTDTIACMAGALLGSIAGDICTSNLVTRIQDHHYVRNVVRRLLKQRKRLNYQQELWSYERDRS